MTLKRLCDNCKEEMPFRGGYYHVELESVEMINPRWDFCSEKCIYEYFGKKLGENCEKEK